MRVLVADDDIVLREELGDLLARSGHAVDLAEDGDEALVRLEGGRFDVALLDLAMPGVTGLEVLRRAKDLHPETAWILMTAFGTVESAVEAMKLGATDFILKPFEFEVLDRILQALEERTIVGHATGRPDVAAPEAGTILAALLTYRDGTLVGARALGRETMGDEDLVGATLNVIQNFMRTSFPLLKGKPLRTIIQGNCLLVLETGRYCTFSVVTRGGDDAWIRPRMRRVLAEFELTNDARLQSWRGFTEDAREIEGLFDRLLEGERAARGGRPPPRPAAGEDRT